jgi:hypothetical protein
MDDADSETHAEAAHDSYDDGAGRNNGETGGTGGGPSPLLSLLRFEWALGWTASK